MLDILRACKISVSRTEFVFVFLKIAIYIQSTLDTSNFRD